MPEALLHRCPPLRAWLSEEACAMNHRQALRCKAAPRGGDDRIRAETVLSGCLGCPGVEALYAGQRELPEIRGRGAPSSAARRGTRRIVGPAAGRKREPQSAPAGLLTLRQIEEELGITRHAAWMRLARLRIDPVRRGRRGVPSFYARAVLLELVTMGRGASPSSQS
jgi:hypothetical protein